MEESPSEESHQGVNISRGIHILGASGSGTSTLGREIALQLGGRFLDTDDFYWLPSDPPFQLKRPANERVSMLLEAINGVERWVLSGSLCSWGDELIPHFRCVVFLEADTRLRLERLRHRESQRIGAHRLMPGGDFHKQHLEFLEWAAAYDAGPLEMRSRQRHEAWIASLPSSITVIRLDGTRYIDRLAREVIRGVPY